MKLNWFKLVQICLNLNQKSKKCIFLVKILLKSTEQLKMSYL